MRQLLVLLWLAGCLGGVRAWADADPVKAGYAANDHGDYDGAVGLFGTALQNPHLASFDRALAFDGRGVAYLNLGRLDQAIADFTQAVQLNPGFDAAFNNRGGAYQARGDLDGAIADYSQALRLDNHCRRCLDNRGSAYYARGDLDHAIADFSHALSLNAGDETALLGRGAAFQLAGINDLAITDLNKALGLQPNNPYALNNRANAWAGKGDYAKAEADFARSLALLPATAGPQRAQVYRSRGDVRRNEGHYSQALADYGQALQLVPADADAGRSQALTYLEAGQFAEALAASNSLLARNPAQPYVLLWRYLAQVQTHDAAADRELAQASLQVSVSAWPFPVLAYYQGTIKAAQLQAATQDHNAGRQQGQQCEAAAYAGAFALVHGQPDPARQMLKEAERICPHNYAEYSLARALAH